VHGNVYEWCRDWYQETLPGGADPERATQPSNRVIRGGSRGHHAVYCRTASRNYVGPGFRLNYLGFRVVRSSEQ
jgi:formylglycine-generating enzyme required for sulfatase activity